MNENPEELMIKEEMLLNIFKHFTDYEIEILLGNATTEEVAEEIQPTEAAPALTRSETVERSRILLALDETGGNRNTAHP